MIRPLKIFIIYLFLTTCKSNGQNKIDVPKSLILFKEGIEVMKQGFTLEFTDSLAAQKYFRQAINKFNISYQADTTHIQLGTYLSDLYYKEQKFDSALLWALRLFPIDSMMYYKGNERSISNSYGFIGRCYLYEGDLQNGKKYIQNAYFTDTTQVIMLSQILSDIADQFFYKSITKQISHIYEKKIDPCKYSIELMLIGLTIGFKEKFVKEFLFTTEKINDRGKNCR